MIIKTNTAIPLELRIVDLFGQAKTDITSVSVRIYHRESGSIVEDVAPIAMSGSGSLWYYSVSSGLPTAGEYIVEYTIIDSTPLTYIQTEQLEIGYLESDIQSITLDVNLIKQIESGKWKIEGTQMKFYDNTDSVILTFDLKDITGNPTNDAVFERTPV